MSKGEILYVKGMNMSESDEESDEDIWDDSKLNAAYDKAVSMANAEIAKRIAMSTNSQNQKEHKNESVVNKSKAESPASSKHQAPSSIWKAGMACRAVYEYDGLEYEAFVLRIINNKECIVRFLGYENSEIVSISSLKPSLGKEVRAKQIQDALEENPQQNGILQDEASPALNVNMENTDCDSDHFTVKSGASQNNNKKKKSSKKKKQHKHNEMPDLPFQMPMNMSQFSNLGIEFPIPPPPVTLLQSEGPASEEQAVSSMLLSWYMSGYCTGYYQGMKRSQKDTHKKH